jgi:hypothetical protein
VGRTGTRLRNWLRENIQQGRETVDTEGEIRIHIALFFANPPSITI